MARQRILFVILAHDRPAAVARLARTLVAAGSDARAILHFDAAAPQDAFAALEAAVAGEPRIALVRCRVRCAWGDFSLVEATLRALAEARADAASGRRAFDHVMLLSGACLPCRPVSQLERFLAARPGREFIETADETWPVGGLRAERWTLWHPLPPMRHSWIEKRLIGLQRLIGISRAMPGGLTPRLGGQWWCLQWETCLRLLDFAAANPAIMRFFRTVWVPDEMVFPTLVHHLVPPGAVAGFGLTHARFTDRGKPLVFHDDHAEQALALPRFFLRKVSPEARALNDRLLARAAAADDGAPLDGIDVPLPDTAAEPPQPGGDGVPGQAFAVDQRLDCSTSVLRRATNDYVVVLAPLTTGRALIGRLPEPPFVRLGAVFHPDGVDLGPGRHSLGDLRADDGPLRDLHPALYLVRLRRRAAGVPVLLWTPRCDPALLAAVRADPAALVVPALPETAAAACGRVLRLAGAGQADRTACAFADRPWFTALTGALQAATIGADQPVA